MMLRLPIIPALAALAFTFTVSADALGANIVPNPGFEQGGCGADTPVLCAWETGTTDLISQDATNPHTGSASMHLACGPVGCVVDPDSGLATVGADETVCAEIGQGTHAASFWYRDAGVGQVSLDAGFYGGANCTGLVGQDSLDGSSPGGAGWQQVSGSLHAPTYTQSARFTLSVSGSCEVLCPLVANFDDLYVADAGDPTPTVTSFTPTTGWFGAEVWIYGFDFLGATSVTFDGTPAQFSVESDGFIRAHVPSGAASGPISVTTANGTGWSSTPFTLVPPPTISSFSPTGGVFGTVVDIHGAHFSGALAVAFTNNRGASFTVDSDSEIHATVPDGATSGPISVTTLSGTVSSSSSFAVPTPTLSSFTPTSGPAGTSVDIRGTNFTGAIIVTFSGQQAAFTVDSDSEIHATVPTPGRTGPISVATNAGSVWSSSWFAVPGGAPGITSVTPMSGPVGTSVDIRGDNLTGATSVTFGDTAATFTVDSDSELHTTVPSGATNSYIRVVTPIGSATLGSLFLVTAPAPTVSSFSPTTGPAGTSVDIRGSNFTAATAVSFNGTAASFTFESDSELYATVPEGATSGPISVRTPKGTGASSSSFTVNASPTVRFTFSCTGLTCHLDGSGSADSDGTITGYAWDFGDGTSTSGSQPDHTYAHAAGYPVTLTVTDDAGATGTTTNTVTPISLTARGYRVKTLERVDLSWNGPASAWFDVYRNGAKVTTVQGNAYTDPINKKGSGAYTYKVCAAAVASCSDPVTVIFTSGAASSRATRTAHDGPVHRGRRHHTPIRITHTGRKRS
jgi:PKD repeat protein